MVLPDRVSGVLRDVASGIVAASLCGGASLWRLSQLAASRHNSLPHPGASASVGALFLFMKANS